MTRGIKMKKVARTVQVLLEQKVMRIQILRRSNILDEKTIIISDEVEKAIEILRKNPNKLLDWFSATEIAFYIASQEV